MSGGGQIEVSATVTNYAELMKGVPDMFLPASRNTSASHSATRRASAKSAPNLLYRSVLGSTVKKGYLPDSEVPSQKLTYSHSGHRCWSSLKTREWQELQRMLNEESMEQEVPQSTSTYFYFASPNSPSRASRRASRKQMGSPDSGCYQRERLTDFKRIETAWDRIKSSKHQKRLDFLSGIPNSNVADKNHQVYSEYCETLETESKYGGPSEAQDVKEHAMSRPMTHKSIPLPYVFPKPTDFVPTEGTKLAQVGVDWKYAKCHREKSPSASHSAVFSASKRLRTACPVTEGLCKEHTSVSKIQGKSLGKGEWDVSKVWKRKLTEIVNPTEMARRDVQLKEIKHAKKEKGAKKKWEKDIKYTTMSLEAQSLNNSESLEKDSDVSST